MKVARKHMAYAAMAAYRAAVMMPWDLNLVMFHAAWPWAKPPVCQGVLRCFYVGQGVTDY